MVLFAFAPFKPLSPEFCCDASNELGYSGKLDPLFLFLFLLRALPCCPGLGCRRCQKILG